MKRTPSVMGIDQYGQTYHDLGKHPRKELLRRLGRTHGQKMYRDPDGTHTGYVIGGLWIELYVVAPWGEESK